MSDAAALRARGLFQSRATAESRWLVGAVLLVAAAAPFERVLVAGTTAGASLSTTEAAVAVAVGVCGVERLTGRRALRWRTPITAPALAVLAALAVAALAAAEYRAAAWLTVARAGAAAGVAALAVNALTTPHVAMTLVAWLLGTGAVVGMLATLELAQVGWVMEMLRAFRPGFHVVGGQIRATSTLAYPTIASMYLEVVFAVGLALLVARPTRRASRLLAFIALALVGAGIVATFTRAGLLSLALTLGTVGAIVYARGPGWQSAHLALALLAAVLAGITLLSRSPGLLAVRFGTDTAGAWYGAAYDAPRTLTIATGATARVPVQATNLGRIDWRSDVTPPFALSYHWLDAATDHVIEYDGARTPFRHPVSPGETTAIDAVVHAPGYPGRYILVWDVVQEHRTWLSVEGVEPARTVVNVAGPVVTAPPVSRGALPGASRQLPRMTLWQAAGEMLRDRPLTGVGPGNYRHLYGRYLGLADWDRRIHANSTYLEMATGAGIVGVVAAAWFAVALARAVWRLVRGAPASAVPLAAGLAAAWLSIAGHGLVDAFTSFTPTYVVFGLTLGLTLAPGLASAGEDHADRV
ncbi:MAG: O-antigen ligase family protein [Acidobacteriota bacterium]